MFKKFMRLGAGAGAAIALIGSGLVAAPALADDAAQDAAGLAINEVRWTKEDGGDLGSSVGRWSCDINGDGREDVIIGDWWWNRGGTSKAGAAYVMLGGDTAEGGPVGAGAAVGAVRIDGPNVPNAFAGMSVSCLNDINGDGYDDLIVGSNRTQRVWVILGGADFAPVDVDALGADGFEVTNSAAIAENAAPGGSANFGFAVTGLGDVNGDGLADFAIVDNLYDRPEDVEAGIPAASNIGRVWVIAGSQDVSTIDVAAASGEGRVLQTIDGSGGQIISAENVGDINGDGLADTVLGSYAATPWGADAPVAGAAYAIFGSATPQRINVGALGENGFSVYGGLRGRDRLGTAVAPLGDVNGDGLADFIVGGDGVTNAATGVRAGGAAVVFGSASTQTVFTAPGEATQAVYSCDEADTNTTGTCAETPVPRGYWIDGAADGDKLGWSVAGIGDLNGDGVSEALLGAYGHDSAGSNAGAVYVVYGQAAGNGTISVASLDPALGFRIDGAAERAQLGRSVGSVADFDGNGVPDVVGGANGSGYASVFLLGPANTELTLEAADLSVATGGMILAKMSTRAGEVAGTVSFSAAGEPLVGCEAVPVDAGSATCTTTGFAVGGEQTVTAVFHDEAAAFADATAELVVDVAKIAKKPVLVADTSGITKDTLEFAATLPEDATGEVEFFAGEKQIGSAAASAGTAAMSYVSQNAQSFQLTAKYSGDARYEAATSKAARVIIGLSPVYLSAVKLGATSVVYGTQTTVQVSAAGATSGTVVFSVGSNELGSAKVKSNGQATLKLPKLAVGKYRVSAQFLSDDTYAASVKRSATQLLTVTKAQVKSAKVTTKAAKKNTRPTATISLGKLTNGAYPTGKMTVSFGSQKTTVTLKTGNKGVIKVKAPKALKSNTKVTAKYAGTANIQAKSATATQKIK